MHTLPGYLGNPEANSETIAIDPRGKWVNSGDIGHINAQGNIFIVDRKKDLIKVRGWQVSPNEVESRIQQHPAVLDVGVIGVPLPSGEGEMVRAYVVRHCDRYGAPRSASYKPLTRHDSKVTGEEIKRFAGVELARYKIPGEIVFTESIPRNPTGKILRRVLREDSQGQVDEVRVRSTSLQWLWRMARQWVMAIRQRISWIRLLRTKGW